MMVAGPELSEKLGHNKAQMSVVELLLEMR